MKPTARLADGLGYTFAFFLLFLLIFPWAAPWAVWAIVGVLHFVATIGNG